MSEAAEDPRKRFLDIFEDPAAVARYADGPRQFVPGVEALHKMAAILIAERAPADAKVLVLGAGGGMELKALADAHPGWSFVGVDPAAEMLRLTERTLGDDMARTELVRGYVEQAHAGPFDAAVCLLTLHFLDEAERRATVSEIRRRLRPEAPFVTAHNTLPLRTEARSRALHRYAQYGVASGADPDKTEHYRTGIDQSPSMLPAELDEDIFRSEGFSGVELFYAGFSWRGWVCYAGPIS